MKLFMEHFDSIREMLATVGSRKNNSAMVSRRASMDGTRDFTGTRDWEHAMDLFQNGYHDPMDKLRREMAKTAVKTPAQRRMVSTGVVGYAPHVPNAILGLPNSMIHTKSTPQKIKTVSIIYSIVENCFVDVDEFIKCGTVVLNAVNALELAGVRVNLRIAFYCAKQGQDFAFGSVMLKDYREHVDLLKLCFPLVNPSMFRRFGFKWIETVPGLTDTGWSFAYGESVQRLPDEARKMLKPEERFVSMDTVRNSGYDAQKLIESIK